MTVHVRQLHFIFKISDGTQPANQDIGLLCAGEVGHQIAKSHHLYIRQMCNGSGCQRDAFIQIKHRFFTWAGGNGQNHPVEHTGRAGDDIKMTIGNRIEGTRINRFCAHGSRFL
ncbi:hypothetical protein D3C76_1420310 [compost metagenome]